jgi:hypothetical protein
MKKLHRFLICITALYVFNYSNCKKDNASEAQLPPETTTGAMTFGCKINGKVFVPRNGRGKGGLEPEYVNLGSGPGGGWFLNIPATDWKSVEIPVVRITADSLLVTEGLTYLFKNQKQYPKAEYETGNNFYQKLDTDRGELKITKFNQSQRILSGIFFFDATNTSTGEKVSITEGRFDIRY